MSWRDHQGPASFRGVPFYTDTSERGGGRHVAIHEFPFSEKAPFSEDLGMKGRTFTIDAYVIGENYERARDALYDALETPGAGELVHPYYGTRRVAVVNFRVRESRTEGGFAQFSLDLVETTAKAEAPFSVQNPAAVLETTANTAVVSVGEQFVAAYSRYTALRDTVAGQFRAIARSMNSILDRVTLEAQANASLRRQLLTLSNNAIGLVNAPSTVVLSFTELLGDLAPALVGVVQSPSATLLLLYNVDLGTRPAETTPVRELEAANFDAVQRFFQRLVLIEAARVSLEETFESYDAAVLRRDAITELLDAHLEGATDDTYPILSQLRSDLVLAVPGEEGDLPKLQKYTPLRTVPSLVLAHRLYGDTSLESDLVLRNKVKNPGFITGGVELEILSRD